MRGVRPIEIMVGLEHIMVILRLVEARRGLFREVPWCINGEMALAIACESSANHALLQAEDAQLTVVGSSADVHLAVAREEHRVEGSCRDLKHILCAFQPKLLRQLDAACRRGRHATLTNVAAAPRVDLVALRDGKRVVEPEKDLLDRDDLKEVYVLWQLPINIDLLRDAQLCAIARAPRVDLAILSDCG